MKLIVTIPAYNEENSIRQVIKEIPRKIKGIRKVEVLVLNDGSQDRTSEVAKAAGADYVVENGINRGLAFTFRRSLYEAVKRGADIIVNTDADFQYNQQEIPKLIRPILEKKADYVSGDRRVSNLYHMPFGNKYGNVIGTKVVGLLMGRKLRDASSGFRAISKDAAMKLNIFSKHTYTHETLIQTAYKGIKFMEVPVEFRKREGKSKLIGSIFGHIRKSLDTIFSTVLKYKSFKVFFFLSLLFMIPVIILGLRFLYYYLQGKGAGMVQSLILLAILAIFSYQSLLMALQSVMLNSNREMNEEILYYMKKQDR
jgi:glycosyltransferase involved in cell wall biosynthesis